MKRIKIEKGKGKQVKMEDIENLSYEMEKKVIYRRQRIKKIKVEEGIIEKKMKDKIERDIGKEIKNLEERMKDG